MAVKLTVCGGGVLGSQIAYQAAYVGVDVTIWLRGEGSIGRAKPKLERVEAGRRSESEGTSQTEERTHL